MTMTPDQRYVSREQAVRSVPPPPAPEAEVKPGAALMVRAKAELVRWGERADDLPARAWATHKHELCAVWFGAKALRKDWSWWVRNKAKHAEIDEQVRLARTQNLMPPRLSKDRADADAKADQRFRKSLLVAAGVLVALLVASVSSYRWTTTGELATAAALGVVVTGVLLWSGKYYRREWLARLSPVPVPLVALAGIDGLRWWPAAVAVFLLLVVCEHRGVRLATNAPAPTSQAKGLKRRDWISMWETVETVLVGRGKGLTRSDALPLAVDGDEVGVDFGLRSTEPIVPEDIRALEREFGWPANASSWVGDPESAGSGRLRLLWADPLPPRAHPRRDPMSCSYERPFQVAFREGGRTTSLNLNRTRVLLAGDSGCIAPWTRIYLPERDEYVRVDVLAAAGDAVTVQAWDAVQGWVRAQTDGAPFVKGRAPLYEVRCSGGATMTVTGQHRFLTPSGWRRLDELHVGQLLAAPPRAVRAEASLAPSSLLASAPRSTGTDAGSRDGCSTCLCRDGRRPRHGSGSARAAAPSPIGGRPHDRCSWPADDPASVPGRSHACRRSTHASAGLCQEGRPGCGSPLPAREGGRTATSSRFRVLTRWLEAPNPAGRGPLRGRAPLDRCDAVAARDSAGRRRRPCEWASRACGTAVRSLLVSLRSAEQSLYRSTSPRCEGGTPPRLAWPTTRCSALHNSITWEHIEDVRSAGFGLYYDLSVPGPENYVAEGLVNHNSGKSEALQVILDAVCDMPDATWSAIDLQDGPTFPPYSRQWNCTGLYTDLESATAHVRQLRAWCKGRNRQLKAGMDYDEDGLVDAWWIVSDEPGRRGHVLFVDELSSATVDKGFASELTLLLEVIRKASGSAVLATPDLDKDRVPRAVIDQTNVQLGFACPFSDSQQLFGKGSTQSGWEPYELTPSSGDDDNDAGKCFIRGGGLNLPEVHRFGRMDKHERRDRNKLRRLWRERFVPQVALGDDAEVIAVEVPEPLATLERLSVDGDVHSESLLAALPDGWTAVTVAKALKPHGLASANVAVGGVQRKGWRAEQVKRAVEALGG